jgi:outer membrane protein
MFLKMNYFKRFFLVFFGFVLFPLVGINAQGLKNLTLKQAINISLSSNPEIVAARALVEEKQGEEMEAKSAVYPSILAKGTLTLLNPTLSTSFGLFAFPIDTSPNFNTSLQFQYLIYNGGIRENTIKKARLSVSSQKYFSDSVKLQKVLAVKEAFLLVLFNKFKVLAARWFLNSAEANESTAEQLYKTGVQPRLIFLNAKIRVREAKEKLSNAEADYKKSLDNLAISMGLKPGEVESIHGNFIEDPIQPLNRLLQEAYQNRPEIKQDDAEIQKARLQIKIANAAQAPSLFLFAGGSYFTRPFIPFFPVFQEEAGLEANWSFEFGKKNGRLKQAKSALAQVEAKLKLDKESIALQLSTAYIDALEAHKEVLSYAQNLRESRESFEDAMAAFANNLISSSQLDETLDLANQTQIDYLQALYRYNEALARISSYVRGKP